ncbi:TIGR00730 family Rossman fold protein [Corynebacterium diphtheriae]|nr:TIGR00730 family Rossman fold protein [Corynebacterium diphtheriae]QOE67024.1 TIGR00730 family Rossman fold protein [Corynebacterium diphtheriae bv. mitis]
MPKLFEDRSVSAGRRYKKRCNLARTTHSQSSRQLLHNPRSALDCVHMSFSPELPDFMQGLGVSVHAMTNADVPAHTDSVLRNLNRFEQHFTADDLAVVPLSEYTFFNEGRGDIGIVVQDASGAVVGTMCVQFIKGLAYLNPAVPEMTLRLDEAWRGKGIGGWLIEQATEYGRLNGWPGIAVNVEKQSPARRLYARHDFAAQDREVEYGAIMLKTLSPKIRSVAVYCGSAVGERPEYAQAARELGTALAQRGITMVYGGGRPGLMGIAADAAIAAGGKVHGVMPHALVDLEQAHPGLSALDITDTMAQRKTRMEELADAFVVLPGGMGTMEEMFQVLVRQQLGPYAGPVALMNIEEFWDPFIAALRTMSEEGFISERYIDALVMAKDSEELFQGFSSWVNPGLKWLSD